MASTDDPHPIGPIRMDHNEQALSQRYSDGNETRLLSRVLWIAARDPAAEVWRQGSSQRLGLIDGAGLPKVGRNGDILGR